MRERYRLKQGGIPVAWAEGAGSLAEIHHYAAVYSQDGPVQIEHHYNGQWRRLPKAAHLERTQAKESE